MQARFHFRSFRFWATLLGLALMMSVAVPIATAESAQRPTHEMTGTVSSGTDSLVSATVTAYSSSDRQGAKPLGSAQSDSNGDFTLSYVAPTGNDAVVYLTTEGGEVNGIPVPTEYILAVVVGTPTDSQHVALNDLTTVASAFAMAQFVDGSKMTGSSPGITVASEMVRHLVNIETGAPGATLTNDSNGSEALTLNTFDQLGNLLVTCSNDGSTCESMLGLALSLDGEEAADTFRGLVNIAKNPWQNAPEIYALATATVYQPVLADAPTAWTLSLKFKGDPTAFAGPANIAVGPDGDLWVGNNYVHEDGFILPDCAGDLLYRLDPATGDTATYSGGGVDGVGYGITFDPNGDVWVGNFGFKGSTCQRNPFSDSVSQFTSDGVPLSPDIVRDPNPPFEIIEGGGWTQGDISWPQGTVSNRDGDIWISNCGANSFAADGSVTVYRKGNPDDWFVITDDDMDKPFDTAFDTKGNAWVSSTNSDRLYAFDSEGRQAKGSPFYLGEGSKPMGVASDSLGNVWVSLSGILELPCPSLRSTITGSHSPAVGLFNRNGQQSPDGGFTGGGLTIAWGIAVDGSDNVFVANFEKGGLSHFCGANEDACPSGSATGDALSPDGTGYASELLDRNTGVQIDSSGNVWLANNWKDLPIQTDPAGDGLVVFLGLASPVRTPMVGPPRHP